MSRSMSLRFATVLFALLTCLGTFQLTAKAEVQCTAPVDFHRFIVNNSELGTLLTTNYQEGVNLNFAFYPFPGGVGKIAVPPAPGWTPVAGQGLQPLYRYHITQNGRIYYGYFNGFASGSGYTFQGIAGYTLPGFGQFGGVPLQAYYSQTKGYFYTAGSEVPIGYPYSYGFSYHGSPAYLPNGSSYCWQSPPPACSDPAGEENCNITGGTWNPGNCTCSYFPPGCRQAPEKGKGGKQPGDNERPPLECREVAQ